MKTKIILASLSLTFTAIAHSEEINVSGLYSTWCLTGMATELDGERIPDKASYIFTKDNQLKYDAGAFKQEGPFTIEGNKIKTKSMGNYRIESIKENEMILYYGGYMFFKKGDCK